MNANDSFPPEVQAILDSIAALDAVLDRELDYLRAAPKVTPEQVAEVEDLVRDLKVDLHDSDVAVRVSEEPVPTWNTWVLSAIGPKLAAVSARLNTLAGLTQGCCFYNNGTQHFPSTQDECNLPGSTWSPLLCPA